MQFVKPIPFEEAIDKLGRRSLIGSKFTSSEWADVPVALREQAFFSSRVESVRVLQRARDGINDFISANREDLGNGVSALKVGSRQQFVDQMQRFLAAEGIERGSGGLTDITSERRLGLVFDVQTQQNQDFGYWKQGMDGDVLNAFPAQAFIRVKDVKEPRNDHAQYEDKVFLKTDPIWAKVINKTFGVPWGPFGFGCGHDVEDRDREEAESLGMLQPGQKLEPDRRNFAENMQASARGLDPDLRAKLQNEFGERLTIDGDVLKWNTAIKPAPIEKPTPKPAPKPAATDKPTPAPAPAKEWRKGFDGLLDQYKLAKPSELPALREQARSLIEVPAADRGSVQVTMRNRNTYVSRAAKQGRDAIERFVAPELVNNTKVSIHATREYRSFHRGGEVHLWSGADGSTAAHEIMHAVEQQNPEVLKSAAEFLLKRADGENPMQLALLTGNPGYRASEVAYKDKWVERYGSVYAGKVYSWHSVPTSAEQIRATEVMTVGIERLLEDPLEFYRSDRDWFDFLVKTLRGI